MYLQKYHFRNFTISTLYGSLTFSLKGPEAELNEFELWLKQGWFNLKLYSMFQYLSRCRFPLVLYRINFADDIIVFILYREPQSKIINIEKKKQGKLHHFFLFFSDETLMETLVNPTCPSINGGSLKHLNNA